MDLEIYLRKCLDAAKVEYDILPRIWFRWRDGRVRPACSAYAAVLLYEFSEKNEEGKLTNFNFPSASVWFSAVKHHLNVSETWLKAFMDGFNGFTVTKLEMECWTLEDHRGHDLGIKLAKEYIKSNST